MTREARWWIGVLVVGVVGNVLLLFVSGYTAAWLAWGAAFWAIEGSALFTRDYKATLTAHLRAWFSFEGKARGWRIRRAALLGGLAWLSFHLLLPRGWF